MLGTTFYIYIYIYNYICYMLNFAGNNPEALVLLSRLKFP